MTYLETIEGFQACLITRTARNLVLAKKGCLTDCAKSDAILLNYQIQTILDFVPPGQLLTPGFVGDATLDVSSFSAFGTLLVSIQVAGTVIANMPEAEYLTLPPLITAIVAAINASSAGYSAQDNGNSTITVFSPGPTAQANGFIVSIVINPTFGQVAQIQHTIPAAFQQSIQINDSSSNLYGTTLVGYVGAGPIRGMLLYKNRQLASDVDLISIWPALGASGMAHNPVTDRIYIGQTGRVGILNSDMTLNNLMSISSLGYHAVYNPFNQCIYFSSSGAFARVVKISQSGLIATILPISGSLRLEVNLLNGDVWVVGTNAIHIIDINDSVVTNATVGEQAIAINYYPGDGTALSERMLVAFTTPGVLRTYNLDGTVDGATFFSQTNIRDVFYSSIYNQIFVINSTGVLSILHVDGTLNSSISSIPPGLIHQDAITQDIIIVSFENSGATSGFVTWFNLLDDGEETFDGAIEGGVDPTYTTGEGNCVTQTQIDSLTQSLDAKCDDCTGGTTLTPDDPTPPSGMDLIYYGNTTDQVINEATALTLTQENRSGFAGDYSFDAIVPSEYQIIAWPSSLGIPTSFINPSTGFPVAMATFYNITINLVLYTVAPTFNVHGGGLTIRIT